jgi:hypothetical protein
MSRSSVRVRACLDIASEPLAVIIGVVSTHPIAGSPRQCRANRFYDAKIDRSRW